MYCPSCGTEQPLELSYCSRCGANLNALKGPGVSNSLEKSIESTVWSIAGITLAMLGIMVAIMAIMIGAGLTGGLVVLFMALMILIMLGLDGLFLWQLSRLKAQAKEARAVRSVSAEPNGLGAKREHILAEPRMSVTEDTTRALESTIEDRQRKL